MTCALTDSAPVRRSEITARRDAMAEADTALARQIAEYHLDRKRELERVTSRAYRARKAARLAAEREAG